MHGRNPWIASRGRSCGRVHLNVGTPDASVPPVRIHVETPAVGVPPVLGHGQDGHATAGSTMSFPTGRKFIKNFSFLSDRKSDSTQILLDNSLAVLYTG
jgi:hypothetical protein